MKIYFSGSISAGRGDAHIYEKIIELLKEHGEVLTEHIGNKLLSNLGENKSPEFIYQRDINFINEADIIIAEVTMPSLGVGYEIAYAEKLNKKILCLYRETEGKKLSFMIKGNPNCKVSSYKNVDELPLIINEFFK